MFYAKLLIERFCPSCVFDSLGFDLGARVALEMIVPAQSVEDRSHDAPPSVCDELDATTGVEVDCRLPQSEARFLVDVLLIHEAGRRSREPLQHVSGDPGGELQMLACQFLGRHEALRTSRSPNNARTRAVASSRIWRHFALIERSSVAHRQSRVLAISSILRSIRLWHSRSSM
jgi:hypothetical protein